MKEPKAKRKWGMMLLIVIIMIGTSFSVFLFNASPQSQVVKYNDIKFRNNGNAWLANIDGKTAAFSFLPGDVQNITSSSELPFLLRNKIEIDTTSSLNDTYKAAIALAQHQMGLTLGNYNLYVRRGFDSNNTFNFPVITCYNATQNVPVVHFQSANSTEIIIEKNCVIVNAQAEEDIIKAKDKLVYIIVGVIK